MAVKKLIERIELDSSAASVTFSSIPQTFTDLVLVCSLRCDHNVGVVNPAKIEFNSITTGYNIVELYGDGSTAFSSASSRFFGGYSTTSLATANTFGNSQVYISNYTSSNGKSASFDGVTENNGTEAYQAIAAQLWDNPAAVTSFELTQYTGIFVAGCTFSLYGITRGGSGTVTTA